MQISYMTGMYNYNTRSMHVLISMEHRAVILTFRKVSEWQWAPVRWKIFTLYQTTSYHMWWGIFKYVNQVMPRPCSILTHSEYSSDRHCPLIGLYMQFRQVRNFPAFFDVVLCGSKCLEIYGLTLTHFESLSFGGNTWIGLTAPLRLNYLGTHRSFFLSQQRYPHHDW